MAINVFMMGVNVEYKNVSTVSSPKTLAQAIGKCLTTERGLGTDDNSIYRVQVRGSIPKVLRQ